MLDAIAGTYLIDVITNLVDNYGNYSLAQSPRSYPQIRSRPSGRPVAVALAKEVKKSIVPT